MNAWDIYEITSDSNQHGVKLRGRIRKFSIENNIDLLVENSSDKDNVVCLALKDAKYLPQIQEYLNTILDVPQITLIAQGIQNPVLSKLKVNDVSRY